MRERGARLEMIEQLENPFPGLRPFNTGEHFLFFGRDGQSEAVMTKLEANRFVAVVGTSGSGKSSLVRAGLLPSLYSGLMRGTGSYWRMAIFRPQDDPIGNLAQALASSDVFGSGDEKASESEATNFETTLRRSSFGLVEAVRHARMLSHENLLVVVDQFEELFRFKQDSVSNSAENEKAAFVKLLLEAVEQGEKPIYVILTMRSDYLGECSQFRDLPEAINKSQYLIPRMSDDERRESIAGPIAVAEGKITVPLVNRLLNDVGDNPDQLPILQHALMRTWDEWKKRRADSEMIDISHYESIGGVSKALSNDADMAYNSLSEPRKEIAKKLFKRLTEKGLDNREVRRPTTVREICEVAEIDQKDVFAVIEAFRSERRCFLMTQDNVPMGPNSVVDISHESLIRVWERLNEWVDEEAQSARIYTRLASDSEDYILGKTSLRPDPGLQIALDWYEREKPNKAWADRYHPGFEKALEYLDKSKAAREAAAEEKRLQEREKIEREQRLVELERKNAEERAAQAQAMAEQQIRAARRLRRFIVALIVMFALAVGTTIAAGVLWLKAKTETSRANEQTNIAKVLKKEADDKKEAAIIAKGEAETAKEGLVKAIEDLKIAQAKVDEEHERAEEQARAVGEERFKAIQNLGNLYGEAFANINDESSMEDEAIKKRMERLEEILKVYKQAGVPSGQISTLTILKSNIARLSEPQQYGKAYVGYNDQLLSLLDDKRKARIAFENGDIYGDSEDEEHQMKAAQYYEQALSLGGLDPDKVNEARFNLSIIYHNFRPNDPDVRMKAIKNSEARIRQVEEKIKAAKSPEEIYSIKSNYLVDPSIDLGEIYMAMGDEPRAEQYFNQVREIYLSKRKGMSDSGSSPSSALYDTYFRISGNFFNSNNTEKALKYYNKAIDIYIEREGKSKSEAIKSFNFQLQYHSPRTAKWFYEQSLKLCREINDDKTQAEIHSTYAYQNKNKGNYEEAITAYKAQVLVYEKLNDSRLRAFALDNIGETYFAWGKYDEALNYLNQSLEVFKLLGEEDQQKENQRFDPGSTGCKEGYTKIV